MNHDIFRYLKPVSIAAHRGSCGGNIPPNTIAAYEAALYQGADILEADVARSADGVFYMFHTGSGNEKFYLGIDCAFENLTSRELDELRINNDFGKDTLYRLDRVEDVLKRFKNRCVKTAAFSIWTDPGNTGKKFSLWCEGSIWWSKFC